MDRDRRRRDDSNVRVSYEAWSGNGKLAYGWQGEL
jgi:hypothetical protein